LFYFIDTETKEQKVLAIVIFSKVKT